MSKKPSDKDKRLSELTKQIVHTADAIFTAQHQQAKRLAEYRRVNESRS